MEIKNALVLGFVSVLLAACGASQAADNSTNVDITPAPNFILPNALGGEVSLSDYEGQPVFLFFHMAVG